MLGNDEATKQMGKVAVGLKVVLEVLAGSGPIANFLFGFGMSNLSSLLEGI
jgi:hypothetical protein